MTASRIDKYESRDLIVPEPRCMSCALGIPLDTDTYRRYRGPVPCPHCLVTNFMAFGADTALMQQWIDESPLISSLMIPVAGSTIPSRPLADYNEAVHCVSVKAWNACAVMTRRALQGALRARGVRDGRASKMIADARKTELLSERQYQLAMTVTFFGGKGAHSEDGDANETSETDAEVGLSVTRELLLALFPAEPS